MMTLMFCLLAVSPAQGSQEGIWDRLKFQAEGRMRAEATLDNVDSSTGNEIDDRFRGRMRFRFGAMYELADELDLNARISTASDGNDANNPHWDFGDGDGFNGGGIVMDRFFVDWEAHEDVHVRVGKQPHAFVHPPIYGEFIWDDDVSPSGVTASWTPDTGGDVRFDARAAAYVATEVGGDKDPKMFGAQGNVYLPLDEVQLQVSSSFSDWRDNDDTAVAGNQGNSATTGDFFIWDAFVAGTVKGGPMEEMTGYVQYINNLDESDDGFALGAQLGSNKWERGNFNAFLVLYHLDGDAVFSPVAQDDTAVAGTGLNDGDGDGMDGVAFGGRYFWRDNVAFKLWVLTSNAAGADEDPVRIRLDMDFRVL